MLIGQLSLSAVTLLTLANQMEGLHACQESRVWVLDQVYLCWSVHMCMSCLCWGCLAFPEEALELSAARLGGGCGASFMLAHICRSFAADAVP